jgi:thioredoxin reductase
VPNPLANGSQQALDLKGGRIAENHGPQTSLPGVFRRGDCVSGGQDLTVQAVQDSSCRACDRSVFCAGREFGTQMDADERR